MSFVVLLQLLSSAPLCDIPTTVYVDLAAPPSYDRLVTQAIEFWNGQEGRIILIYGGRKNLPATHLRDATDYFGVRSLTQATRDSEYWQKRWYAWVGRTFLHPLDNTDPDPLCVYGAQVWVDSQKPLRRWEWEIVMTHELGHVLGFGHADDEFCVMHRYPLQYPASPRIGAGVVDLLQYWYR